MSCINSWVLIAVFYFQALDMLLSGKNCLVASLEDPAASHLHRHRQIASSRDLADSADIGSGVLIAALALSSALLLSRSR